MRQASQYLTLFVSVLKSHLKPLVFLIQQDLFLLIFLMLDSTDSLEHISSGMRFSCSSFSVPVLFIYLAWIYPTCVWLVFPQNNVFKKMQVFISSPHPQFLICNLTRLWRLGSHFYSQTDVLLLSSDVTFQLALEISCTSPEVKSEHDQTDVIPLLIIPKY